MKRMIAIAIALLLICGVMAACTPEPAETNSPTAGIPTAKAPEAGTPSGSAEYVPGIADDETHGIAPSETNGKAAETQPANNPADEPETSGQTTESETRVEPETIEVVDEVTAQIGENGEVGFGGD